MATLTHLTPSVKPTRWAALPTLTGPGYRPAVRRTSRPFGVGLIEPEAEPTVEDWLDYMQWAARMDEIDRAYEEARAIAREEAMAVSFRRLRDEQELIGCLAGHGYGPEVDRQPE